MPFKTLYVPRWSFNLSPNIDPKWIEFRSNGSVTFLRIRSTQRAYPLLCQEYLSPAQGSQHFYTRLPPTSSWTPRAVRRYSHCRNSLTSVRVKGLLSSRGDTKRLFGCSKLLAVSKPKSVGPSHSDTLIYAHWLGRCLFFSRTV